MRVLKAVRFGQRLLRARIRRTPVFLHLVTTRACNLSCSYCYQHEENSQMMSLRTANEVIEKAKALGFGIVSFTGGEPLLWDALEEAMSVCSRSGMVVSLTTNGHLLSYSRIDRLAEAGLDQMIVSVDAVGSLEQSEKTLDRNPQLLEYMSYAARRKGILVSANCVLGSHNAASIGDLIETLSGSGFALSIGFLDPPPVPSEEEAAVEDAFLLPKDSLLLERTVREIIRLRRGGRLVIEPEKYFLDYSRHLAGVSAPVWSCRDSKKHSMQVAPSGKVLLCTRRHELDIPFATLTRSSLQTVSERIGEATLRCNANCYCNCSYNNAYYQSRRREFLFHVALPALVSRRRIPTAAWSSCDTQSH